MHVRGIHNSILFFLEKEILQKKTSILGGVLKDRKLSERKLVQKKSEVKAWLLLFAKHVGDKLPDEQVTVLPYRQIKPIWEEYKDDVLAGNGLFGQPCKLSHF